MRTSEVRVEVFVVDVLIGNTVQLHGIHELLLIVNKMPLHAFFFRNCVVSARSSSRREIRLSPRGRRRPFMSRTAPVAFSRLSTGVRGFQAAGRRRHLAAWNPRTPVDILKQSLTWRGDYVHVVLPRLNPPDSLIVRRFLA